jgi:hypothetical protein
MSPWTALKGRSYASCRTVFYMQQIAYFYIELDRTSFASIGSLRLGGVVGQLDYHYWTRQSAHWFEGLYESLQAFWRGHLSRY